MTQSIPSWSIPSWPVEKLSFEQTVPRKLAHRQALGEVFIADSVESDDGAVFVAAQIPRAHSLWGDRPADFHDPFSTAEAARQGSFVMLHRHLGVPVGLPFSMKRWEFRAANLECFRDNGKSPLDGVLRYEVTERVDRGAEFSDLTLAGELRIDGTTAMTLTGDVVFLRREDYVALREFQLARRPKTTEPVPPAEPLDPARVGRDDVRNVVVGEPVDGRFRYVIDTRHPSYFDHEYDHVPGPFIIEGFRQAALVVATEQGALPSPVAAVTYLDTTFLDFAELDAPVECTATLLDEPPTAAPHDSVVVELGLYQFGKRLADARLGLSRYPR